MLNSTYLSGLRKISFDHRCLDNLSDYGGEYSGFVQLSPEKTPGSSGSPTRVEYWAFPEDHGTSHISVIDKVCKYPFWFYFILIVCIDILIIPYCVWYDSMAMLLRSPRPSILTSALKSSLQARAYCLTTKWMIFPPQTRQTTSDCTPRGAITLSPSKGRCRRCRRWF